MAWVDWSNNRRLLEPLRHVPPTEFEAIYDDITAPPGWSPVSRNSVSREAGRFPLAEPETGYVNPVGLNPGARRQFEITDQRQTA